MAKRSKYKVIAIEGLKHIWGVLLFILYGLLMRHLFIFTSSKSVWMRFLTTVAIIYGVVIGISLMCKVHTRQYRFTQIFFVVTNWLLASFVLVNLFTLTLFHLGSFKYQDEVAYLFYFTLLGFLFFYLLRILSRNPKRRPIGLITVGLTLVVMLSFIGVHQVLNERASGYSMHGTFSFPYIPVLARDYSVDKFVNEFDNSFKTIDQFQKDDAERKRELRDMRLVVDSF